MRTSFVLSLPLAVCFCAAVALAADDPKQELEKLQGNWSVVSAEINGVAVAAADLQTLRRTVMGNEILWKVGAETVLRTRFKIDPSQNPKHWDVTFLEGDDQGKVRLGLYELKGDDLKICVAGPDGERPLEFATKPNSGGMLLVLKRE